LPLPFIRSALFAAVLLLAGAADAAAELTRDALKKLNAGEVLVTVAPDPAGATGVIEAAVHVKAPVAVVWAAMLDCGRAKKFISGLESCRVVRADPAGQWDEREHTVRWFSMMPVVRSVFRSDYDLHQRIRFKRTDGDLAILEGQWRFEALAGGQGTRLLYSVRVGIPAPLPNALLRPAIESGVEKTLAAIRTEAQRGLQP
jgi:ribosome-associated toxin RatA of RatAB toxin-antitoxin module